MQAFQLAQSVEGDVVSSFGIKPEKKVAGETILGASHFGCGMVSDEREQTPGEGACCGSRITFTSICERNALHSCGFRA